ncbi:hypothetical protein BRARA_B03394 [Brassica rapa]|uniref:Uncharacterized protein n=2 Tax=Brassica TaxID=3705 RepID=A0A398AM60_BRACM|nr:hypothetical protein BRARA_B03394 [Brassica rapa]
MRFLLLRQRIEFPSDKPNHADDLGLRCQEANRQKVSSSGRGQESNGNGDHNMIDPNSNPQRVHEPGSNHQNFAGFIGKSLLLRLSCKALDEDKGVKR